MFLCYLVIQFRNCYAKSVCIIDTHMDKQGRRPMWSGRVELAFQCVNGSKIGPHDHRMSLGVLICHIWYSALK